VEFKAIGALEGKVGQLTMEKEVMNDALQTMPNENRTKGWIVPGLRD